MSDSSVAALVPCNKSIIGLYFSADYCRWCKEFTPILSSIYADLQDYGVEIVFVASDKSEEAYNTYRMSQPWSALAYSDELRSQLRTRYAIKTIPALLFFTRDGTLVEKDGRALVMDHLQPTARETAASVASYLERNVQELLFHYDSDYCDF